MKTCCRCDRVANLEHWHYRIMDYSVGNKWSFSTVQFFYTLGAHSFAIAISCCVQCALSLCIVYLIPFDMFFFLLCVCSSLCMCSSTVRASFCLFISKTKWIEDMPELFFLPWTIWQMEFYFPGEFKFKIRSGTFFFFCWVIERYRAKWRWNFILTDFISIDYAILNRKQKKTAQWNVHASRGKLLVENLKVKTFFRLNCYEFLMPNSVLFSFNGSSPHNAPFFFVCPMLKHRQIESTECY